jgi:hypothetical protein
LFILLFLRPFAAKSSLHLFTRSPIGLIQSDSLRLANFTVLSVRLGGMI